MGKFRKNRDGGQNKILVCVTFTANHQVKIFSFMMPKSVFDTYGKLSYFCYDFLKFINKLHFYFLGS